MIDDDENEEELADDYDGEVREGAGTNNNYDSSEEDEDDDDDEEAARAVCPPLCSIMRQFYFVQFTRTDPLLGPRRVHCRRGRGNRGARRAPTGETKAKGSRTRR